MQTPTLLILATSCLSVFVTADPQSADSASLENGASLAPLILKQQQQQQQQQNYQPLQQFFHPRYSHLASNYQANVDQSSTNSAVPIQITNNHDLDISHDNPSNVVSTHRVSDTGGVGNSKSEMENSKTSKVNNYLQNNLHSPLKLVSELSYKKEISKSTYNFEDNLPSTQDIALGSDMPSYDHRVDKREAAASFPAVDGQTDSRYQDEYDPIYLARRFQVFIPSTEPFTPPYLSAQEFKETFRRSDPYFMGKRTADIFSDDSLRYPVDMRAAPMFVGKRDAPYFVGKRDYSRDLDRYLAKLASEDDVSPLLKNRRAAPKFIGRRGAPFFVGKRGAPKFVGKRLQELELEDTTLFPSEDKRDAPKFVGRRASPYLIDKRELSNFAGKRWNELSAEDELNWLLENQNSASKFVGRRGAPYFVGKRGAPYFVGRRGAPYFVGKRRSPMFVGKRNGLFEAEDEGDDGGEFPFLKDSNEMENLENSRISPYLIDQQQNFIDKLSAKSDLQNQALAYLEDKRRAPKFVGKRGSPYLVGKRGSPYFVGKRGSPYFVGKRGSPYFVGKRGSPYFVGKRGSPYFVGKRMLPNIEENDFEIEGDEYEPQFFKDTNEVSNFENGRFFPYSVSPQQQDFEGKLLNSHDLQKQALTFLEDKRKAPKFVGKRDLSHIVSRQNQHKFVAKRFAASNPQKPSLLPLQDKRKAPKFIGKRGSPYFVGKRTNLLEDNFEVNDDDDDHEAQIFKDKNEIDFENKLISTYISGQQQPNFVGKLSTNSDKKNQALPFLEEKRRAPKFVGKRGSPFFVGKRGSPFFVGKRGSPFFVGKRGSPYFVGKRGSPYFVGKRGSPYFVGKRMPTNFLENDVAVEVDEHESQLHKDKNEMPNVENRLDSPYYSSQRLEDFVDKISVNSYLQNQALPIEEDKRRAPKFIGRRGAPKFVGRRGAPTFVGKRGAPKFVGKRNFDLLLGQQ